MTLLSKFILAGYAILHILFIYHLDSQLNKHFRSYPAYQNIRRIWIIAFSAAAAVPAAVVFMPESTISLFLQRIGNVFLAFDLHIGGLFLLVILRFRIVSFSARKNRGENSSAEENPRQDCSVKETPGRNDSITKTVNQNKSAEILPLWLLILILAAGTVIPLYGMHHAQDTVVHYSQADLRENNTSLSSGELRIALIADLHLGVNSHLATTQNMVSLINEQKPDIVLIAGDIFTSSYTALRDPEKHADALSGIRAPMGVYAVYGNHDVEETLFGGFAVHPVSKAFRTEQIEQFFRDCGFTTLCDETVSIADGSLLLAGRIDGNKAGDGTKNRLTPAELLKDADPAKPILVLEHEPVEYKELREAGADMILSGHTHNGQIFPGNIYVKLVSENGYGHKMLYGMETFVTSGVGTFGPPMRTGTDSEIMIIDVRW